MTTLLLDRVWKQSSVYTKKNEVVLQAGNITEAKALVKDNDITIAFIDIHLGKESGLNFLEWIVKEVQ